MRGMRGAAMRVRPFGEFGHCRWMDGLIDTWTGNFFFQSEKGG